jgi:hypothetical protein
VSLHEFLPSRRRYLNLTGARNLKRAQRILQT